MDNPFQQQSFINWLLGGIMSLLTVLATLFSRRIDTLESAHREIISNYVTRDELSKTVTGISATRTEQHTENSRKLERIEDSIDKLRDQLNEVPYRHPGQRTRSTDR